MDLAQNKTSASNKGAGWVLLALGVAVILWSMNSSYQIFTGKTDAPEMFKSPAVSNDGNNLQNKENAVSKTDKIDPMKLQNLDPADLQKLQDLQQSEVQEMLQKNIASQFEKMIPADTIMKMMNLSSWSIFIFIFIYAGSKIAGLGIKLLKD